MLSEFVCNAEEQESSNINKSETKAYIKRLVETALLQGGQNLLIAYGDSIG